MAADASALWMGLAASPLFGVSATLLVYVAVQAVYVRLGQAPWANPVLWSIAVLAAVLTGLHIPYAAYFNGAQLIHFLLGPAVVALGLPLWERRAELRRHAPACVLAGLLGGGAAAASAVALGWALGLPREVLASLAPKSVTTPVAMGIAEQIGGVPALTAVIVVLTGVVGAVSGKYLFAVIGIGQDAPGWRAQGFALGTAAHGVGAARALQVNADAGAWAGLALGVQVLLTVGLIPLLWRWLAG